MGRFFWATYLPIGLALLSFLALSASLLAGLFEGWRAALLFGAWVLLTFFFCLQFEKSVGPKLAVLGWT